MKTNRKYDRGGEFINPSFTAPPPSPKEIQKIPSPPKIPPAPPKGPQKIPPPPVIPPAPPKKSQKNPDDKEYNVTLKGQGEVKVRVTNDGVAVRGKSFKESHLFLYHMLESWGIIPQGFHIKKFGKYSYDVEDMKPVNFVSDEAREIIDDITVKAKAAGAKGYLRDVMPPKNKPAPAPPPKTLIQQLQEILESSGVAYLTDSDWCQSDSCSELGDLQDKYKTSSRLLAERRLDKNELIKFIMDSAAVQAKESPIKFRQRVGDALRFPDGKKVVKGKMTTDGKEWTKELGLLDFFPSKKDTSKALLHRDKLRKVPDIEEQTVKEDLERDEALTNKSCNLPYDKWAGDLVQEYTKLFKTKSFSVFKSKYGDINDIRSLGGRKSVAAAYPKLMGIIDTIENAEFNQPGIKFKGVKNEGYRAVNILFLLLFYSNRYLDNRFNVLQVNVNFNNESLQLLFTCPNINQLRGPGKTKFNITEPISNVELDPTKKYLIELNMSAPGTGHATAFVIEDGVGYHFDSNRITYNYLMTEQIYDEFKNIFNLTEIKLISELNDNCSFTTAYQKEPASCATWTAIFLNLVLLNPHKSMQYIANYWGWKIGKKLDDEISRKKYLNDKLKSFSAFILEFSGYEGDYDTDRWTNYMKNNYIQPIKSGRDAVKINITYPQSPGKYLTFAEASRIFKADLRDPTKRTFSYMVDANQLMKWSIGINVKYGLDRHIHPIREIKFNPTDQKIIDIYNNICVDSVHRDRPCEVSCHLAVGREQCPKSCKLCKPPSDPSVKIIHVVGKLGDTYIYLNSTTSLEALEEEAAGRQVSKYIEIPEGVVVGFDFNHVLPDRFIERHNMKAVPEDIKLQVNFSEDGVEVNKEISVPAENRFLPVQEQLGRALDKDVAEVMIYEDVAQSRRRRDRQHLPLLPSEFKYLTDGVKIKVKISGDEDDEEPVEGGGRSKQDWEKNEGYFGKIMDKNGKLNREEICRYCYPSDYAKGARKFCKIHDKVWEPKTNSCKNKKKKTKKKGGRKIHKTLKKRIIGGRKKKRSIKKKRNKYKRRSLRKNNLL